MRLSQIYSPHNTAWSVKERKYKQRLTHEDIEETLKLFSDFGLCIPVPDCTTIAELLKLRKSEILKLLL